MNENLSPGQFARQAAHFDNWAKSEQQRLSKEHEVEPGRVSYPREAGRRMSRLIQARTWLNDTASAGFYEGRNGLAEPLHELLPLHHDLVDEYKSQQR